jgi:phospholipid/cholesterol/gamma-HCH transport system substrate-binding protein
VKIRKETKIGIVVVVSIVLLYIGVNFLKGIHVFNKPVIYYGMYERVNGLQASNPVVVKGYKIGQVRSVELIDGGRGGLLVTMTINEDVSIPIDSRASLKSSDLLGSMQIDIKLGRSAEMAQSGDTLTPVVEGDLVDEVNAQLRPIKMKAESLISSVDSVIRVIEVILNPESQQNLIESFNGINNAIASLERTAFRIDDLVKDEKERVSSIMRNIDNITKVMSDNSANLTLILENFSTISDNLAKADIARTINSANEALSELKTVMDKINSGQGSMGLLINDDKLYKNLANASDNLDLLMEDVRVNPNRYVQLSVFGKKTKKVELSRSEMEQLQEYINSPK